MSDFPHKNPVFLLPLIFLFWFSISFSAQPAQVRIDRGDSLTAIASHLKETGLIRSTSLFKIYSLITGAAHRFKPGIYSFYGNEGLARIITTLMKGPSLVEVVVTEGLTLKDIDHKLSELAVIKKGELINYFLKGDDYWFLKDRSSLEGFLFPDTYKFSPGTDVGLVVKTMIDNFDAKAAPLLSKKNDWYNILILASLLEKEVSLSQDRLLVADILQRRLKIGMPLQVDATVTYLKCDGEYLFCNNRQLIKSDFKIDSPYNSYLYKGLPPSPIANPGLAAISAVLNPKKNSYLFYLTDPRTKKTVFSKTFDDHDDQRAKHLR